MAGLPPEAGRSPFAVSRFFDGKQPPARSDAPNSRKACISNDS